MFDILTEVNELYPKTKAWREDFHRNPELSNHEERTSKIVADHLRSLGLEVEDHIGGYGVVGILHGEKPGRVVAFRADMDALPIQEATGLPYSSQRDGVMHACGHDGHTAMLMTTAEILSKHADEVSGTVKFIFQPAEEGGHGAQHMVESGVLENPKPDVILGAHMMFTKAGTMSYKVGDAYMTSDTFSLTFHGHGGHGAKPQESTDTLLAACRFVTDLQMIVSRRVNPLDSAVVTVGTFHSGTKENIIPDEAVLSGTIRTLNTSIRTTVLDSLHKIAGGICEQFGTTSDLNIENMTGPVYNDPGVLSIIMDSVRKTIGNENVEEQNLPRSGSEDFSEYLKSGIPGVFLWVGGAYPDEIIPSKNHQPTYNWDENAMKTGCASEIAAILGYLNYYADEQK